MKILITGGAGYIGSTVASACEERGIQPVVLDDFSTGLRAFAAGRIAYEGDIADAPLIDRIVSEHPDIDAVVHCAAAIVVPDSVARPLEYYDVNVGRAVALFRQLARNGIRRVIFSSSASIYAPTAEAAVDEGAVVEPSSPYASTKAMVEQILHDATAAGELRAIALRYFNPIGADPALRTGLQNPEPSHALGRIIRAGESGEPFIVTGVDWPTRDGSGVRDYVHVWDLARAHVEAALRFDDVATVDEPYRVVNLGTGAGTTVLELLAAFERVTGTSVPYVAGPRRPGDAAGASARADLAERLLGWRAELSIEDGIRDALAWAAEMRRRSA